MNTDFPTLKDAMVVLTTHLSPEDPVLVALASELDPNCSLQAALCHAGLSYADQSITLALAEKLLGLYPVVA